MASTGCCCGGAVAAVDGADAPCGGFGPAAAASSGFPPLMVGMQVAVFYLVRDMRSRERREVVGCRRRSAAFARSIVDEK